MINTVKEMLKKHSLLLFSFLCAALFLFICSKSSPLYPMNDWVDVHCFLTLGRGLLHGAIPYVDLYEQKGPVLYLIYAIISLFCGKYMIGQYIFEVLTYGLFLYFSAKIAGLYLGERSLTVYAVIPILAVIVGCCASFSYGGSVEQAGLFLFAYGLYSILKACIDDRPLTFKEALINGIFAGIALWVKYTMLGFYFGLALFVLIWYLIRIRSFKKLMAVIGQFLLGIGIVSVAVIVFFLCVGGLKEMFTCYFYNNIFLYRHSDGTPFLQMILNRFRGGMKCNRTMSIIIILGFGWLLFRNKKHYLEFLCVCLTMVGLVFGTYTGASYIYYSLVLGLYVIFGLIAAVQLLREFQILPTIRKVIGKNRLLLAMSILCVIVACSFLAIKKNNNAYMLGYDREDMPQYKFAKIINETEDATVLNFGFLDGGFYYAADIVPNCPIFCTFNVDSKGMLRQQAKYIVQEKVDYVITRDYKLSDYSSKFDHYELISTANMYFDGIDFTYYLYRLKGDS